MFGAELSKDKIVKCININLLKYKLNKTHEGISEGSGTNLIGVSDAGEIASVVNHNRLKSRLQSTARSTEPPIELEVESVGRVLRVVVPPQKRKPYFFGGRFFMRIGANGCGSETDHC